MRFLSETVKFFVSITAGILLICAVSFAFSGTESLPADTLWNILIAGALTSVVTTVFYYKEENMAKLFVLKAAVHYILLCVIMFFFGVHAGWIDMSLRGAVNMFIDVAIVYVFTYVIRFFWYKMEAKKLNEALKKRYKE
ncbi:MAG: DUF3021 family protein [Oscillospiraceae bacterium]